MDLNELFEIVDIESAEDFKHFDNFAALMESDDYIPAEVMYELFAEVDTDVLSELTDNYFEDIMEGVPEEEAELFTLLDNIKRVLKGYAENTDDERSIVLFRFPVSETGTISIQTWNVRAGRTEAPEQCRSERLLCFTE